MAKRDLDAKKSFDEGIQKMKTDLSKLKDKDLLKNLPRIDFKKQLELSRRMLKVERNLIIVIVILTVLGLVAFSIGNSFTSLEDAAAKFRGLGVFGPFLLILLIILEIIVPPIPGTLFAIAAGFAFGTAWGALFVYLGSVLGCSLAFFISRRFGRPFVERVVPSDKLEPYDLFFKRRGVIILWLAFALPIFPSDVLSYVAGLSDFSFRKFITIVAIGSIPGTIILTYLGSSLVNKGITHMTLYVGSFLFATFLIGMFGYLYLRKRMKDESVLG